MTRLPEKYPLHEIAYGHDLPVEQLFVHLFDAVPSKMSNGAKKYSQGIYEHLLSKGFVNECEFIITGRRYDKPSNTHAFLHEEKQTLILLRSSNDKTHGVLYEITVYYNVKKSSINSIYEEFGMDNFAIEIKKSGISLVKSEMGHLDTEEYEMNVPDIDLELNYGTNFVKIHELIIKRLNAPQDKGIILFHGDPGTGKTSYIKYLTRLITDKEILFIPPAMAESLSEPSIIPFLMEHKNSILIVEDAERVIADREGNGSSVGVSNILNLTDGILGDCLNIQVIATFNMKREKIDQALLRKGRLIAEHKFEKLSVDETNRLLEHLNKEKRVDKGMTLADIYNIDEEIYKTENNKNSIGFNN
jgi:hypothetical protein